MDNSNIVIKSADKGGAIVVLTGRLTLLRLIDNLIILNTIRNCLHRFFPDNIG